MRYNCLINITCKNTFCSHFWHFGWPFIQLSIFQLPAVKLLEVFAHYVNTGKETLSPFIGSSIDKVLLQINAGCTSRFLTLQTFLNFIWSTPCCISNRLLGPQIRIARIYWRFLKSILARIMLGFLSLGSAKQTLGEVETKTLIW